MLDDILHTSLFTLIAAGVVAVAVASLPSVPNGDQNVVREAAMATVKEPALRLSAFADSSPIVVQLPRVVVTGRREHSPDALLLVRAD